MKPASWSPRAGALKTTWNYTYTSLHHSYKMDVERTAEVTIFELGTAGAVPLGKPDPLDPHLYDAHFRILSSHHTEPNYPDLSQ